MDYLKLTAFEDTTPFVLALLITFSVLVCIAMWNNFKTVTPEKKYQKPQNDGPSRTRELLKRFTQFFWFHYYSNNYPSYRDQPLWNYLYLKRNIYPYVDNELRSYFNGFKTIWRSKENY